jgi:O-succinylbenzoic acid--CoA ligase
LDWLAERAIKTPHHTALIYEDQSWDFATLNKQVAVMAACLSAAGAGPGDHVAVLMPNSPDYVALIFALTRIGCLIVPLNTRLTKQELRWQIEQADCSMLIGTALEGLALPVFSIGALNALEVAPQDIEQWRAGRGTSPEAMQAIIYTSGTTGRPKGTVITYANHRHSAEGSAERLGLEAAARWLLCMPLYHVGGLSIVLRCCLYGTTVVLHDNFDVAEVNRAIDHDQITMISLVPTMLHRLIDHRGKRPFPPALKCVLLGGAAASPKLIKECLERDIPIALTYGLTEACSQVATATPDQVRAKPGTVGKPITGTSIKIVDESGASLLHDEIGEIAVAGGTLMQGYYAQPDATDAVLHGGWLHTGDLGYLDEEGDLWVVQRRADLIVSGGENVYPAEVEAALETHPLVKEACVVGIEDAEWGQRVAALVVTASQVDGETLIAHCREQIAGYKCPRIIHFVASLPKTASGKVLRGEAAQSIALWMSSMKQVG